MNQCEYLDVWDFLIKMYFEPMLAVRDIWMVSLAILAYWCWCFSFLSITLTSLRTFATTAPVDPTSYNGTAEQDRLELQENLAIATVISTPSICNITSQQKNAILPVVCCTVVL